jgi:hypothetical protein
MAKHCIFEHFFSFVNQNRAKSWVVVTLQLFSQKFIVEMRELILLAKQSAKKRSDGAPDGSGEIQVNVLMTVALKGKGLIQEVKDGSDALIEVVPENRDCLLEVVLGKYSGQ